MPLGALFMICPPLYPGSGGWKGSLPLWHTVWPPDTEGSGVRLLGAAGRPRPQ